MEKENLNIFLLIDSRRPGGIESHVLQLANGLSDFGCKATVVFLANHGPHPLRVDLNRRGIRNVSLDGSFSSLWKLLHNERPSVLHTHGYKAGLLGRIAAVCKRIPVISTYHAGEVSQGKLAVYDWLDRFSACLAAHRFSVSPQIAERLPASSQLADNFVNTNGLKVSGGSQIAFVGRLSWEKGPDRFLLLANQFPYSEFHFYGDGTAAGSLLNNAPPNLYFHGQQDNMSKVWKNIGLLVMPSRHEGMPMAALEAMARGIPVLASRVGSLDKLIDNNLNGWLVTQGDMDKFIQHLSQWMRMDKNEKRSLKTAAQNKVQQQFSTSVAIPKMISTYTQIATPIAF